MTIDIKEQDTTNNHQDEKFFMGFDLSTQQLKVVIINEKMQLVLEESVGFDKDFPQYDTKNGVYIYEDDGSINAPVAMWLEAIDLVFQKISLSDPTILSKIHGISGSCQQHGSVYWNSLVDLKLRHLDSKLDLKGNLEKCLSLDVSPNWQDHSTQEECDSFNELFGIEKLSEVTGSRAHFRFTGPQIMKISKKTPDVYSNTAKIQLVSNFLSSVLSGKCNPMEESDSCGANLFDILNRRWDRDYMGLICGGGGGDGDKNQKIFELLTKLNGEPWPMCGESLPNGLISKYFVDKYGLNSGCEIFPFTGDNLATILSLPLNKNDILVSMGTSTTVLIVTDQYHPSPNYHMFLHPTMENHYMGMICYCNGSLAREKLKDQLDPPTWEHFNKILDSSAPSSLSATDDKKGEIGNFESKDEIGVYFPLDEIVPSVGKQTLKYKFDLKTGDLKTKIESALNEENNTSATVLKKDIKNIVESQALSCRVRIAPLLSSDIGVSESNEDEKVKFDYDFYPLKNYSAIKPNRIFFVGGASQNDSIIKKFAQVIGVTDDVTDIYRLKTTNSCALGGCYKALWSYKHERSLLNDTSSPTTGDYVSFLNENFNWEQNIDKIPIDPVEYNKSFQNYTNKIKPLSQLEQLLQR